MAAICTDVPAISMQARGPVKNSPRANRAANASGTAEARIFKRNMVRYPPPMDRRQAAYGWQTVKENSYRGVDAGCLFNIRTLWVILDSTVIASAAKQSISQRRDSWIASLRSQ
jgi:hypothetical protein